MMKNRTVAFILLASLLSGKNVVASGIINDSAMIFSNFIYDTGAKIGSVNLPEAGPLKYILPFAVVGICAKEFPKQTLFALSCLAVYLLAKNEMMKQKISELIYGKPQEQVFPVEFPEPIDENIFVFDADIVVDSPQVEAIVCQEQQADLIASQVNNSQEYDVQEFIEVTNEFADAVDSLEQMSDMCDDNAVLEMHDEMLVQEDEFTSEEASNFQADEDKEIATENSMFEYIIEQA